MNDRCDLIYNHSLLRRPAWMSACLAAMLAGAAAAQPIVYNAGHADIGIGYDNGAFDLHYHFDGASATYEPPFSNAMTGSVAQDFGDGFEAEFAASDVFTRVPDPSTPRPAGAPWSFTGTAMGGPLWTLPQISDPLRPFLGFGSEELDSGDWNGNLTIALSSVVAAPAGGEFSLYATDFLNNPTRVWDTQDDDFANDFFTHVVGSHDHFNFGFTAPGVYHLEITASGVHLVDGAVSSSAIYTFLVGDNALPPADVDAVPEPSSLVAFGACVLVSVCGGWLLRKRSSEFRRSSFGSS